MDLCVVIVDDDVMLGKIQKALLESVWPLNEPIVCVNGHSALERIDREAAQDKRILVLLDIHMPEMDGWGVLDMLRSKSYHENVWVVLNTSSDDVLDEIKSRSYTQVIKFNKKPLTKDALRQLMIQEPLVVYF